MTIIISNELERLTTLADRLASGTLPPSAIFTLRDVAKRLKTLAADSYKAGYTAGYESYFERSNIEPAPNVTSLDEAVGRFTGEIKVIPPKVKQDMKDELTVDDLDLEDL